MTETRDGLLNDCDAESEAKKRCVIASREKERTADNWLRLERDPNDHLIDVYQNKARFTIIFCSKHYAKKLWTNHERKAAQAKAFELN